MRRPAGNAFLATGLLLVAVAAYLVAVGFWTPLNYDESYNLQVSLHLAQDGRYATDGSVLASRSHATFDHFISTGPTLLAPIGAAMAVLGEHLWVARAVASAYFVGVLVLAFLVGQRIGGRGAGLAAVVGALVVDLSTDATMGYRGTGDVLGEMPATFFVLLAAMALRRGPLLPGVLLGMAVLSKLLMLLALPAFVVAVMLVSRPGAGRAARVGRAALLLGGLALPLLLWTALQVAVLGIDAWVARSIRFLRFFAFGGSGLIDDPTYSRSRVEVFVETWSGGAAAMLALLLATAAVLVMVRRTGQWSNWQAMLAENRTLIVAVGGAGATITLWWVLLSGRVLGRYLVTPLILLGVVGGAVLFLAAQRLLATGRPKSRVAAGCLVASAALLVAGHAVSATDVPGSLDGQQSVAATVVRELEPGEEVRGFGWFQNPEIRFLTGVPSAQVTDGAGQLLLLGPDSAGLEPAMHRQQLETCGPVLHRAHGYVLCRTRK